MEAKNYQLFFCHFQILPGLWGLVNNAGIWYFSELEMMSETIIKKIIDVNLFGAIRMTKSLLPLIRQAKGRIINVSSVLGNMFYCNLYHIDNFSRFQYFITSVVLIYSSQFSGQVFWAVSINYQS
jgi:hypothetical protein